MSFINRPHYFLFFIFYFFLFDVYAQLENRDCRINFTEVINPNEEAMRLYVAHMSEALSIKRESKHPIKAALTDEDFRKELGDSLLENIGEIGNESLRDIVVEQYSIEEGLIGNSKFMEWGIVGYLISNKVSNFDNVLLLKQLIFSNSPSGTIKLKQLLSGARSYLENNPRDDLNDMSDEAFSKMKYVAEILNIDSHLVLPTFDEWDVLVKSENYVDVFSRVLIKSFGRLTKEEFLRIKALLENKSKIELSNTESEDSLTDSHIGNLTHSENKVVKSRVKVRQSKDVNEPAKLEENDEKRVAVLDDSESVFLFLMAFVVLPVLAMVAWITTR